MLIVEDDDDQLALYVFALQSMPCEILTAGDGQDALVRLADTPVTLVLTDWYLPTLNGDALVREITRCYPDVLTILMSTHAHVREVAHECGATGWYRKNDGIGRLRTVVSAVLRDRACPE